MKTCLVFLLCLLLLLVLIVLPFSVNINMHLNIIEQKCFYSIKLLFIKLLCGKTYIDDSRLIIQNTNNLIYNNQKDANKQITQIKSIAKKITISQVDIFFSAGVKDNAYATAMLCGYTYAISSALVAVLISKNPYINIFQDVDPNYNKDALDITLKCQIQISILKIIFALISANKKLKESNNGAKK